MAEPIFVKIRNDQGQVYDSYTDYWRLVALSGFATCELDAVDPLTDNIYIFSPHNGNVAAAIAVQPKTATYILWQLERPGQVTNTIPAGFDAMWVSDRYFATLIADTRCAYVPMGGHKDLGQTPSLTKEWDFVHLSYLYGLREAKVLALAEMGFTLASNGWGLERDISLGQSRYGLCLHQDEVPVIEPLRYTLFSCWQLPLIAEVSRDPFPYAVVTLDSQMNLADTEGLDALIDANYIALTQTYTFRSCVEAAILTLND